MRERIKQHAPQNAIYGLGFIGALFYYVSVAKSLWMGVLGVFKALLWPSLLVYEALKALHG